MRAFLKKCAAALSSWRGQLAKGLGALGLFFTHHSRGHPARDGGAGLPVPLARSAATLPDHMTVTAITRTARGKVAMHDVQLPKDTQAQHLRLAALVALQNQHDTTPNTLDSVRVRFNHLQEPVSLFDELGANLAKLGRDAGV